ncbi:MAG: hypothetical protein GY740_23975 [Gammaproteobacteria bacterium]|nr:hypothetical protein [Gammaproteobacteria bacterium]
MKTLTLIAAMALSFNVQAGSIEECKAVGVKAAKIMTARQSKTDPFEVISKFPDDAEMVIEAFDRPRYDTLKSLKDRIGNFSNRRYQIIDDEVNAKHDNEVNLFKNKYIKACFIAKKAK